MEKRELLVTALLTSPEFVLRMTEVFDVMWIERRPDKHVAAGPWRAFLRPSDWLVVAAGGSGGVDSFCFGNPMTKNLPSRSSRPISLVVWTFRPTFIQSRRRTMIENCV